MYWLAKLDKLPPNVCRLLARDSAIDIAVKEYHPCCVTGTDYARKTHFPSFRFIAVRAGTTLGGWRAFCFMPLDLIGKRFGRLVVEQFEGVVKKHSWWLCRCDCGTSKSIRQSDLIRRKILSCSCSRITALKSYIKHGQSRRTNKAPTAEYNAYSGMWQRTQNPNHKSWKYYGGRGIKVCPRWLESFENFFQDMGLRPVGCSLGRIDNAGDYEPTNCRWETPTQQANNKRSVIPFVFRGKTQNISCWAKEFGIHEKTLRRWITRGWDIEQRLNLLKQCIGSTS